MYLKFFDLKKEPFNITPDPDLLFLSSANKEALASIIYGVMQRKGFVAITGQVGVGKTTIIRSFLERHHGSQLKVIYIFNADISFKALVNTIYQNLGIVPHKEELFEMINQLHQVLIDQYKAGANVVLIVDEAQNMPVETLRALHMLSNLETATEKLIQVVLCGQPELDTKLDLEQLRQLKQRITIRAKLAPLTREESLAYIQHRLSRTAAHGFEIFTTSALKQIVRNAGGIPRVINGICDNCLVTAFGRQEKKVTAKVAREIIGDLGPGENSRWALSFALAAGAVCAVIAALPMAGKLLSETDQKPVALTRMPPKPALEKVAVSSIQPPKTVQAVAPPREPVVVKDDLHGREVLVTRIVRRGDTLAKLVAETYNSVDERLMEKVQEINPQIVDRDYIEEGERISFPVRRK